MELFIGYSDDETSLTLESNRSGWPIVCIPLREFTDDKLQNIADGMGEGLEDEL